MIIFDLDTKRFGAKQRSRVAVIGSCRVRTPLLTLKSLGKLDLLVTQPALTHTFAEAQQNYRHALGEIRVPDVFAPYIFETECSPAAERYPRHILDGIDTVIVEMCDSRQVRKGEWVFQSNYFARQFVQKCAAELLDWYRAFSKGREVTEEMVQTTLTRLRKAGQTPDDTIEDILRHTKLITADYNRVVADAEGVAFDRSKRWIFISHFAVPDDEGAVMKDRRRLAGYVEAAAEVVGAEFFNPTRLLEHYGRSFVLRGGTDIYEYDWDFIPVVGEILLNIIRQGTGPDLTLPVLQDASPSQPTVAGSTLGTPAAEQPVEAPLRAASSSYTGRAESLAQSAERVNKLLVNMHRDRLSSLGLEKSGLYDHYKTMLDAGQLVRSKDVEVARLVIEDLPPFEQCVVLKAGLGSVPLLLALQGRTVTAMEANRNRASAIEAAVSVLALSKKKISKLISVEVALSPERALAPSTLGIAVGYVSRVADAEQAHVMARLSGFDALLVEPRTFLRHRSPVGQARVSLELGEAGFTHVTEVSDGILFASKQAIGELA